MEKERQEKRYPKRRGNEVHQVREALARAVATRQVPDDAIESAAERLAAIEHRIRRIDVCAYGICLDYIFDRVDWRIIEDLVDVEGGIVREVEIFPDGIPTPDILRARVTYEMDKLPRTQC